MESFCREVDRSWRCQIAFVFRIGFGLAWAFGGFLRRSCFRNDRVHRFIADQKKDHAECIAIRNFPGLSRFGNYSLRARALELVYEPTRFCSIVSCPEPNN